MAAMLIGFSVPGSPKIRSHFQAILPRNEISMLIGA
jgi:hypothetical protein